MIVSYVDHLRASRVKNRALADFATIKDLHKRIAAVGPDGDAATALRVKLANVERETGLWFFANVVEPQLTKEDASATDDERAAEMGMTAYKACVYYARNAERANPSLNGVDKMEVASADGDIRSAFIHDCAVKSLNLFDKTLLGGP
jgi:hypothetical protein